MLFSKYDGSTFSVICISCKISFIQPRSCSRAMRAVGVVDATCEDIFELIMSMDGTRFE